MATFIPVVYIESHGSPDGRNLHFLRPHSRRLRVQASGTEVHPGDLADSIVGVVV